MNLFFDLDGTISDPYEGITKSINYALAKFDRDEKEQAQLSKYIGPSLKFAFEELLGTSDEQHISQAIAFYRERYFSIGFKENELYDGVVELLQDLERLGYQQSVVTSKREDIATSVIEYFSLMDCFEDIHGCDIYLSKGELIKKILREKSLEPSETLMIGDRKFDIEAGSQNQLQTIGVLWGYGTREELEQAGASNVVKNLDELRKLLLNKEGKESLTSRG